MDGKTPISLLALLAVLLFALAAEMGQEKRLAAGGPPMGPIVP